MEFKIEPPEFVRISRANSKLIDMPTRGIFYKKLAANKDNRLAIVIEYLDFVEEARLKEAKQMRAYYVT